MQIGKKLILKINNIRRATTFFPYSDRTVDHKKQKYIFDDMGITQRNIQRFETLEQDWDQFQFEEKLQIFYQLMKLMYFLTEKKMEHRKINPSSLILKNRKQILLLQSKFRDNENDAEKMFGKLSQQEMSSQLPYLTEELLVMIKEKKYSDYWFRDYKTHNLADREALGLIILEIFLPDPFRKLRETNLTYQNVLDFRKKLNTEIELQKKKIEEGRIQSRIEIYNFIFSTIETILKNKQLPDQQQFVRQYRNLVLKEKNINQKKEEESLTELQTFHQKNQDSSPISSQQYRLNTQINNEQGLFIKLEDSPDSRNPNNISIEMSTPISNQISASNKQQQSDDEMEEINVDVINERLSKDPIMSKFQIEQQKKIGGYTIKKENCGNQNCGNQVQCKVSNSIIIKGKFNRCYNKLIQGKITQLLKIKDKTFIQVFENVQAGEVGVSIQNQENFRVLTINGENSKLTTYVVIKNNDGYKFQKISQYIGQIAHGNPHGEGILNHYEKNYMYDGKWKEGLKEGYGRQKILDDKLYQQGELYEYRGYFEANLFQGRGRIYMKDDETLFEEGNFDENVQVGFHTRNIKLRQHFVKTRVFYFHLCCQIRIPFLFYIS